MRPLTQLLIAACAWLTCGPALAGGYAPYAPDVLRAVADKTGIIGGFPATQTSSGSTSTTYRHHLHVSSLTGFYNPILIYSNSYILNTGEDQAGPGSVTVKAVLAFNNINYPVTCLGANSGTTLSAGASMVCEPIGVTIPSGADVYVCTYVTGSSNWPVGRALASSIGGEGTNGANGVDDTGSCATGTGMTSGGYSFGPMAIVGHSLIRGQKSIGFVGDSICAGSGDAYNTSTGYAGYLERAIGNNAAWISSCRSSDQINYFLTHSTWRLAYFPQFVSSVINELGTNDLYTAANSSSTVEANLTSLWNEFANRGIAVFQTTILPRTTSTDLWTSVINQTKGSAENNRVAVNDWIRGLPAPLSGYFDAANAIEVNSSGVLSQDGGYWNPSGAFTITGNTHASTTIDNLSTTAGLVVGMPINCSGCASGTQISSINTVTSSIVISVATTSSLIGTTVAINPPTYDGIHPSVAVTAIIANAVNVGKLQ